MDFEASSVALYVDSTILCRVFLPAVVGAQDDDGLAAYALLFDMLL